MFPDFIPYSQLGVGLQGTMMCIVELYIDLVAFYVIFVVPTGTAILPPFLYGIRTYYDCVELMKKNTSNLP